MLRSTIDFKTAVRKFIIQSVVKEGLIDNLILFQKKKSYMGISHESILKKKLIQIKVKVR
jgi:hypothetical protein